MKHTYLMAGALALAGSLLAGAAQAESGWIRARGPNGVVAAASDGSNSHVRGRSVSPNAGGGVTSERTGATSLANGASTSRSSERVGDGNGNVQRTAQSQATGARGTVARQRSAQRTADGALSATRTTQATSSATGASYTGNTSYTRGQGVTHSGVCHDAAGSEIACPQR